MLIVADSSPLNILIRIGQIDLLRHLFSRVVIPPAVKSELSDVRTPEVVRQFIAAPPPWFEVRVVTRVESIPPLDRGEEEAITLAFELRADALLIDERDGRRAAAGRGLTIIGTVGVLEEAARRGLLDLSETFERLERSDFRIDPRLLEEALRRVREGAD